VLPLSDAILLYRCWIIWNKNIWIMALPGILWLANLTGCLGELIHQSLNDGEPDIKSMITNTMTNMIGVSGFALNLTLTGRRFQVNEIYLNFIIVRSHHLSTVESEKKPQNNTGGLCQSGRRCARRWCQLHPADHHRVRTVGKHSAIESISLTSFPPFLQHLDCHAWRSHG
jgi:hypothetical protein